MPFNFDSEYLINSPPPSSWLFKNKQSFFIKVITKNDNVFFIQAYKKIFRLYLYVFLKQYSFNFNDVIYFCFKNFFIRKIIISNSLSELKSLKPATFFLIDLPQDFFDYESAISKRLVENFRYYEKKLFKSYKVTFVKYCLADIPELAVLSFFYHKKVTHGFVYKGTAKDFISEFRITNCYAFIKDENEYLSVVFTSEYKDKVFLENFSYNPDYKNLSIGNTILFYVIRNLIDLKMKVFALGCGDTNNSYKIKFSNRQVITYSGEIRKKDLK